MPKRKQRRITYRRGSDARMKGWLPLLVQGAMALLTAAGLYYKLAQNEAVQATLFEERTHNIKEQLDSLQRNMEGLQHYIIDLHQHEDNRGR